MALAGLGELCCRAEGRNEDRVANMAACNERGPRSYHKSTKYRYGRVVLEALDVRQVDRLVCERDGRQCKAKEINAGRVEAHSKSKLQIEAYGVYKEKKRKKDMSSEVRWREIYKREKERWSKLG